MKLSGLLTRSGSEDLPGTIGVARVDRRMDDLLRKLSVGDIAVVDQVDLNRQTADALVYAGVAGVVNAAPSISGRFPNLGPEILLNAGIPLIDCVGPELLRQVKDGQKIRLLGEIVYAGERELARGVRQTPNSVADMMIESKSGLLDQLEAFSANTIEFLRHERALILDGVGVPDVDIDMEGRQVLVVCGGYDHGPDLKALKHYIREYRPVLIGVGDGAEALHAAGHKPHIIVGDPTLVEAAVLKTAHEVVIPAQHDGHAPGLERIQDLGVGAVTFPSVGNPEDLALLLAEAHGAELIITVGFQATLHEFLDRGRSGSNPSTFLTRLRLGSKLVDGKAIAALHRSRVSMGVVLLMVLSAVVAVATALLVSDVSEAYTNIVADGWDDFKNWYEGLI